MKVEIVNSFVQGAQSTLTMVCGQVDKLGKVFLKQPPYISNEISIIIGIHGDLNGHAIYTMDEKSGIFLASKFMMGFDVHCMDEMSTSALMEISNIISGNAASALFSHGFTVDITTPTYIKGQQDASAAFTFIKPESKLVCMPITFEGEQIFEVDLHF